MRYWVVLLRILKHIESQFEDWMNWDNYGKYNGRKSMVGI